MHRRLGCLCPNYYFSFFYIDNFDYLLSSQQRLVKLMVSWTYIVSITELINPKLHPECIQLLDKSSSHRIWNGKEQNQIIWTKEGKVHLGKRLGFTRMPKTQNHIFFCTGSDWGIVLFDGKYCQMSSFFQEKTTFVVNMILPFETL